MKLQFFLILNLALGLPINIHGNLCMDKLADNTENPANLNNIISIAGSEFDLIIESSEFQRKITIFDEEIPPTTFLKDNLNDLREIYQKMIISRI